MKNLVCGTLLILVLSLLATWVAGAAWCQAVSLSAMIIGILLGMVFANTLRPYTPTDWAAGIKFCSKRILRIGIILYGFRLTLTDVVKVGWEAVAIDAVIVCGTIGLGMLIGRWLKMEKDLTLLTSCGSAICGAAAVLGAEGALRAKPYKTAVAVSTVVIYGTIAMFLYPIAYRMGLVPLSPEDMGIYTGATVHEVAHVVGAGGAMGEPVAGVSIIVKMIRVMMLVPVLLVLAFCWKTPAGGDSAASGGNAEASAGDSAPAAAAPAKGKIVVPWFAILFLLVIVFNSLVALPQTWINFLNEASTFCLTMAMTALGVETTVDKFKKAGAKPFILATLLFAWLILGGFLLVKAFALV